MAKSKNACQHNQDHRNGIKRIRRPLQVGKVEKMYPKYMEEVRVSREANRLHQERIEKGKKN